MECRCHTPPFDYRDYLAEPVGIDETNGRFGDVTVETCRHCGTLWLNYLVEYEAFTKSGRWYRGVLTPEARRMVTAHTAVAWLAALPWYFYGGSYFDSTGRRGSGPLLVDH
jgi:hypothetical protein